MKSRKRAPKPNFPDFDERLEGMYAFPVTMDDRLRGDLGYAMYLVAVRDHAQDDETGACSDPGFHTFWEWSVKMPDAMFMRCMN